MSSHESPRGYIGLVEKLRDFIQKYYLQQIIKGILFIGLILISYFLFCTVLEYNLFFPTMIRKLIYWIFIVGFFVLFYFYIGKPLFYYLNYKKRISHKEAASIIGRHFPHIQDKLLNVLHLNDMRSHSSSIELIDASIAQKSVGFNLIRFNEAIDWTLNRKLLKYLLLPIVGMIVLYVVNPSLISESTFRIRNYNQAFAPKPPFDFVVLNKSLRVTQYDPISIEAIMKGRSIPKEMILEYNGITYPMEIDSNHIFRAVLNSVDNNSKFRLGAAGFFSEEYDLDVIPKAIIQNFQLEIIPPPYTGFKPTIQKNIGEITAPEGSLVRWNFETEHVDRMQIKAGVNNYDLSAFLGTYQTQLKLNQLSDYTVIHKNKYSQKIDTQSYSVSLIADQHPVINVKEFKDSINDITYYAGDVSDDYGVSALYLKTTVNGRPYKYNVQIAKAKNSSFQFSSKGVFESYPKGAEIRYYFEVWDNDGVNGSKSSRSGIYEFRKMTEKEIIKQLNKNTSEIQSEMKKNIEDAKKVQKELEMMKKRMLEKNQLEYSDKKKMEELIQEQKDVQKKLEEIQKEMDKTFDKKNDLTPQQKEIKDQQEQIKDIAEQMKNQDYDKLLEKIQNLLEKSDRKEMMQNIQNMDKNSEKVEKNMERLLQLYKNLDYKQKVNDLIEKLNKMTKEQELAALETEKNTNTKDKQETLNNELKEAKKDLAEVQKLNNELNKTDKKDFEEIAKDLDEAEQKQEEAKQELDQNKLDDGAKSQREAKNKLADAKDKMSKLKKKQKKNQTLEDAKTIRRILENVIHLSFEQERLVQLTKTLSVQAPSYPRTFQIQKKLLEDFRIVEDSLYKVAARQAKTRKMIFEELEKINKNSEMAIHRLVERQSNLAVPFEQTAMEGYNKLGVYLSETLKNMEDESEDENESDQMCNDPKNSKKKKKSKSMSLEKLAEMQGQLNEQMKDLQKKMQEKAKQNGSKGDQKGNQEGQDKNGEKQGQGGQDKSSADAKELARIAAQQQALRNALKQIEESKNEAGKNGKKPFGSKLEEIMDKMRETEKDVVNRRVYEETIKRQRDIQIKLLESAKAEREQEQEERRESERAKAIPPALPPELKRYIEEKKRNQSQINKNPVGLTPYFKTLTEKYFDLIN